MLQDRHGENFHNEKVRITVIIPCYNVAPWVRRCLDSVLTALPPASEIVAVDDGSTDGTADELRDFESRFAKDGADAQDRSLNVIRQENRGVSAARNRALDVARGEYVFFVDPDDVVAPDFFTAMVAALERDEADCCLCGYSEQADGEAAEKRRNSSLKGNYRYRTNDEILRDYLPRIFGYSFDDVRAWYAGTPLFTNRELASACRMVFRRALIEARHIRFDETIALFEDAMFNAEYLIAAQSMTSVDRPLYQICYRDSSASCTMPKRGARYCRNKLALLKRRETLNRQVGGRLTALYAGTNVFSALEIVAAMLKRSVAWREGRALLREYLSVPSVRAAIGEFPLCWRKPLLASAVLLLRGLVK